jgi:catechol 2,3-dioxygenase-like lactoylglutathione lyase family enzyme
VTDPWPVPAERPILNHVAFTMDPALLDERGRAELLDFYGDVFGWREADNTGETGNPLILSTGAYAQFVYLLPGEPHLSSPALDHFGVLVGTVEELQDTVDRAKKWQARDARVRIIDVKSRLTRSPTHDFTLTSAYIGFVLPLMVELQHLVRHERV